MTVKDERLWVTRTALPSVYIAQPCPLPPTREASTDRRPVDGRVALAVAVGLAAVLLLLLGSTRLGLYRWAIRRARRSPE